MKKLLAIAVMVSTLIGFGLITPACGDDGGDALTLEEFLQEVEALDDGFEEESDQVEAEFNELTDDSPVEDVLDALSQQTDLIEGFVDDLADLNAPDEAQDIQDEAVDAGREAVAALRDVLDEAEDAETLDEAFALFESADVDAAFERFDDACFDAQALADENDIDVELNCGE